MNSLPALQDRINKLAESTNHSALSLSVGTSSSDLKNRIKKLAESNNASTRDDRFGLVRKGTCNNDRLAMEIAVEDLEDEISQESNTETDLKQQRLQHFHDLNQQFLLATQQQGSQQQHIQHQQIQQKQHPHIQKKRSQHEHDEEIQHLNQKIDALNELVQHLSHELRMTQDAHQLNKDQSRSEIELLRSELYRQSSRHDQIVASFRKRLVESETARMKMQDQLSSHMEKDIQREEDLKDRWKQMTTRVLEDKKWVEEQMNHWIESMEEHRMSLGEAKLHGRIDADLGGKGRWASPGPDKGGGMQTAARGNSNESSNSNSNSARRLSQRRRRWGESGGGSRDESSDEDDDDSDAEEMRLYGQILH